MTGLDGLRALAVFAVIGFHLNLPFAPGGFLGVALFFVISGYLITDILLSEWARKQKINLKNFFIRRAKRLLPGVFFLLICLTAYVTIFNPELVSSLKTTLLPAVLYFSNWWYIFNKIPYFSGFTAQSLLIHFWSLAVEVQFYLIWPFLLIFGQRLIKKKWLKVTLTALMAVSSAVLMALLYQPGADPGRIYYGTDTRAFSLLLGACLALIFPSEKLTQPIQSKPGRILLDLAGLVSLAGILLMTYFITQYSDFLYRGGLFLFSVVSALLVAAAANPSTIIGKVFSIVPLRFIGNISYGMYLWQLPVIVLTNAMAPSNQINVWLCLLQVAVTVVMATVSYSFIETPIRRKKARKFTKRRSLRGFCENCLHMYWWKKGTVLAIVTLVLISGIGLFRVQTVQGSDDSELSALPSALVITPSSDPSPVTATPSPPQGMSAYTVASSVSPAAVGPAASESVTMIGDSVGIDIAPYLKQYYPDINVDAKVGRQFSEASDVIRELLKNDALGKNVIIELGSNGTILSSQVRDIVDLAGSGRHVVFVNVQVPRSWCLNDNKVLEKTAAEYSNATVADWYSASINSAGYFYKDGVHPNPTGSAVLAKVISEAVTRMEG